MAALRKISSKFILNILARNDQSTGPDRDSGYASVAGGDGTALPSLDAERSPEISRWRLNKAKSTGSDLDSGYPSVAGRDDAAVASPESERSPEASSWKFNKAKFSGRGPDSGYASLAGRDDTAVPSLDSVRPEASRWKLNKAKSMNFASMFNSITETVRWSASFLDGAADDSSSSPLGSPRHPRYETPNKHRSLRDRLSSSRSRSGKKSSWSSKKRRPVIPDYDQERFQSPLSRRKVSPVRDDGKASVKLEDGSQSALDLGEAGAALISVQKENVPSSPRVEAAPRLLWPHQTLQEADGNDLFVDNKDRTSEENPDTPPSSLQMSIERVFAEARDEPASSLKVTVGEISTAAPIPPSNSLKTTITQASAISIQKSANMTRRLPNPYRQVSCIDATTQTADTSDHEEAQAHETAQNGPHEFDQNVSQHLSKMADQFMTEGCPVSNLETDFTIASLSVEDVPRPTKLQEVMVRDMLIKRDSSNLVDDRQTLPSYIARLKAEAIFSKAKTTFACGVKEATAEAQGSTAPPNSPSIEATNGNLPAAEAANLPPLTAVEDEEGLGCNLNQYFSDYDGTAPISSSLAAKVDALSLRRGLRAMQHLKLNDNDEETIVVPPNSPCFDIDPTSPLRSAAETIKRPSICELIEEVTKSAAPHVEVLDEKVEREKMLRERAEEETYRIKMKQTLGFVTSIDLSRWVEGSYNAAIKKELLEQMTQQTFKQGQKYRKKRPTQYVINVNGPSAEEKDEDDIERFVALCDKRQPSPALSDSHSNSYQSHGSYLKGIMDRARSAQSDLEWADDMLFKAQDKMGRPANPKTFVPPSFPMSMTLPHTPRFSPGEKMTMFLSSLEEHTSNLLGHPCWKRKTKMAMEGAFDAAQELALEVEEENRLRAEQKVKAQTTPASSDTTQDTTSQISTAPDPSANELQKKTVTDTVSNGSSSDGYQSRHEIGIEEQTETQAKLRALKYQAELRHELLRLGAKSDIEGFKKLYHQDREKREAEEIEALDVRMRERQKRVKRRIDELEANMCEEHDAMDKKRDAEELEDLSLEALKRDAEEIEDHLREADERKEAKEFKAKVTGSKSLLTDEDIDEVRDSESIEHNEKTQLTLAVKNIAASIGD